MLLLSPPPFFWCVNNCKSIKADFAGAAVRASRLCGQARSPGEGEAHAKRFAARPLCSLFPAVEVEMHCVGG